jgi:hypothetical protein
MFTDSRKALTHSLESDSGFGAAKTNNGLPV